MRTPLWTGLFLSSILYGCLSGIHVDGAGAGAEAGNAITVRAISPNGGGLASARVEVRSPLTDSLEPVAIGLTDPSGEVQLRVPSEGPWSVVVKKDGLAFAGLVEADGSLRDTLRPQARFSSMFEPGTDKVTLPGLGASTVCGADGSFQLDSLPSGMHLIRRHRSVSDPVMARPLAIRHLGAPNAMILESYIDLYPGMTTVLLGNRHPLGDTTWVANEFIPGPTNALPARIAAPVLAKPNSFVLAFQYRPGADTGTLILIDWLGGVDGAIRVTWRDKDSLTIHVGGGIQYLQVPRPSPDEDHSFELAWDGDYLTMNFDGGFRSFLETNALKERAHWESPRLGVMGISKIRWISIQDFAHTE